MEMINATLVIMAGGKSSRMQRDKALLPFADARSLAEYQYTRLSSFFENVYISAKSNKFDFSVRVIADCYKDSSPLVGLVSVFETLEVDEVFVLSVDAPFVDREMIQTLYAQAKDESSVIVALSKNGVEPLCGIYRRSVLQKAQIFLREGNHRLQALLQSVETQTVEISNTEGLMNLNHPFEYEEAMRLMSSV